jgi:hypothetical protein
VDPETASPPHEPDLEAIAADLAAVETTLDELAAGTYRHAADADAAVPPAPAPRADDRPPAP